MMGKLGQILILSFVGILSFLIFLFLSFPYDVLKEKLSTEISTSTGLNVQIKDLSPKLPLGISLDTVDLSSSKGKVTLKRIDATVSILALFMGKVGGSFGIQDSTGGTLNGYVALSLFDLIGGNIFPSAVEVDSKGFQVGDLGNFFLLAIASKSDTNALLKPILEKVKFAGKLNEMIDLRLNGSDFAQSTGTVSLDIQGASLLFDQSFQIENQIFSKAIFKAAMNQGSTTVDNTSHFESPGMKVSFEGKLLQKKSFADSQADMTVKVELFDSLKKQFGFLVSTMTGSSNENLMSIRVSGPLGPGPKVEFL